MIYRATRFAVSIAFIFAILLSSFPMPGLAQSRPQKPTTTTGSGKKNERPKPLTEEEKAQIEADKKRAEEEKNAIVDDTVERVETNLVTLDAVVYHKKTKEIVTGLKKENFAIFENGVKQEISNFATPDTPITVSLVVEYSRWAELFGSAVGGRFERPMNEVVRPVAMFLTSFIKAPDDYASVIAFDARPTTITDFTNDRERIRSTIEILLRNNPAYQDSNLWDALKFTLLGGKGDAVVLDRSNERYAQYGGMVDVKTKRKAIILVASGIDTFSATYYDQIRRIIQEAGVPIYVISTGNFFYKRYEDKLGALDDITGRPGRLTMLQAQNAMNTIAKDSGGRHYPMTFPGEIPDILQAINALLRNQYYLSYDLKEKKAPGTKTKIEVKVDVNGDGIYDEKAYEVQHRPYYITPGGKDEKDTRKKK